MADAVATEDNVPQASSSKTPSVSVTEQGTKIVALTVISKFHVPEGAIVAGKGVAKITKHANKVRSVVVPVAVAIDAIQVGASVHEDRCNGTTRNTVETVASVDGGWTGGIGGATAGAALGTLILPGIGTLIGGILGGLGGGIGGSLGAGAAAEAIGDKVDYDVEEKVCQKCERKFKVRKYKGEKNSLCPECAKPSDGDQVSNKDCAQQEIVSF